MRNQFPPLDNSITTQMRYDLFVEKMNTAQRSYNVRHQSSTTDAVMLVGGIFKIIGGLLLLTFGILRWLWLQFKK